MDLLDTACYMYLYILHHMNLLSPCTRDKVKLIFNLPFTADMGSVHIITFICNPRSQKDLSSTSTAQKYIDNEHKACSFNVPSLCQMFSIGGYSRSPWHHAAHTGKRCIEGEANGHSTQ